MADEPKKELYRDGLTIRDHFAGRSLQAMLGPFIAEAFDGTDTPIKAIEAVRTWRDELAGAAYAIADAMLEERK